MYTYIKRYFIQEYINHKFVHGYSCDYFQFVYCILLLNVLKSNEYLYELYSELCIRTMCIKHIYSYVYQPQCIHLLSRIYALFYLRIHFTFEHKWLEFLANDTKHIYNNFVFDFLNYHVQMSKLISTKNLFKDFKIKRSVIAPRKLYFHQTVLYLKKLFCHFKKVQWCLLWIFCLI